MNIVTASGASLLLFFLLAESVSGYSCADDRLICQDGSGYKRDPTNGCEFPACPSMSCNSDLKRCPDSLFLTRDPTKTNCPFFDCPNSGNCNQETTQCGNPYTYLFMSRSPSNSCQFLSCPPSCNNDVNECGQVREPLNNCQFPGCPQACNSDVKTCSDGSTVVRDPNNNCEFFLCPGECYPDTFTCPNNGVVVTRQPDNDCNFKMCPTHRNTNPNRPQSADDASGGAGGILASVWLVLSSIAVASAIIVY